jgi:hypothetical protein
MRLVETTIANATVRMRYADHEDLAHATEWIDFRVKIADLAHPRAREVGEGLGDPDLQFLLEIRLAALRYARDTIGDETQRLQELAGHTRR